MRCPLVACAVAEESRSPPGRQRGYCAEEEEEAKHVQEAGEEGEGGGARRGSPHVVAVLRQEEQDDQGRQERARPEVGPDARSRRACRTPADGEVLDLPSEGGRELSLRRHI